jgi:MscS family membrane protein
MLFSRLTPLHERFQRAISHGGSASEWLFAALALLAAVVASVILARITQGILVRIARRTSVEWDDRALQRMRGPLRLGWAAIGFHVALGFLSLPAGATSVAVALVRGAVMIAVFWGLLRATDIAGDAITTSSWASDSAGSRALVPIGVRVTKVVIVALALVALLASLGYPVASLVAGLGVGGLAVALAAQKTFENVFGAFTIGVDQPLREGEFVRVGDVLGTVEAIGLRSTRIRTLDRTLVAIPNAELAGTRIENLTARDRMRLSCTLGLVYGTDRRTLQKILAGVERLLLEHPKIWSENVVVRFKELGASSLDIEVMAWFETADWSEFQLIRQEMLMGFMDVVERAGSSFAFPTRTLHVVEENAERPARAQEEHARN